MDSLQAVKALVHLQSPSQCMDSFILDLVPPKAVDMWEFNLKTVPYVADHFCSRLEIVHQELNSLQLPKVPIHFQSSSQYIAHSLVQGHVPQAIECQRI